ncbi:uncharacterized protein LOC130726977 [Lotus japonicus]|uniref:uncharacterized protein LOC130726977 n=1 Tax=Lotus japonicus TaxID=34305 RepID=UPI002588EA30|nr:uncharacterized protein LOC130726977 [Lotus japonicus]
MPSSHAKKPYKPHFTLCLIASSFYPSKLCFLCSWICFSWSNNCYLVQEKDNNINCSLYPMEESRILLELKLIVNFLCIEAVSFLSVVSSDPLFSCIVTFYTLILLYLPSFLWRIAFSPVLVLTGILLVLILRLGAIQRSEDEEKEKKSIANKENRGSREEKQGKPVEQMEDNSLDHFHHHSEVEFESEMGFESNSFFDESFVEWDVKAPLKVIYEDEEEEEAEEEGHSQQQSVGILRNSSLSRYYPESDSDSSSEEDDLPAAMEKWDSPENMCFRWDEEDDKEGLIEIALDGCKMMRALEFHFEEENLIEIDISPTRRREVSGEEELFTGEISCN